MATHKSNVHIDLSGWSPKYFPPELVRAIGGQLRKKVLFGSDYPLISPERWIEDFRTLGVKERSCRRPQGQRTHLLDLVNGE